MINSSSNTLSIIKNTVKRFIPDGRIILFGSRARNQNSDESDFDFLVITKSPFDIREKRMLKSMMRKELARFKIPADILIQSEEEVNSKKEVNGHIVRQVLREGIVV